MKEKIRIGITFFWGPSYKHIWSNGAGQNMYFMKEALMQIPFVEDVYFVFWGNDIKTLPKELEIDAMDVKIYPYEEVVATTDILIEGTLTLEPFYEKAFRKYGTKIISFRMGNDFIWDMEKFLVNKDGGRAFNGSTYDAVWVIPQVAKTNIPYISIMTDAKVSVVPHIWNSFFFDRQVKQLQEGLHFGYNPNKNKTGRRVSVFEPNTSVVKNCYTPVLIAEEVYKRDKSALEHVYLCNTYDKRNVSGFHNFIGYTKLVKENIMTVENRHLMPYFLSRYTDIVLSFQWELGLNYAYYEALYGNYPLVHNSPFLKEANVGYFYNEFDAFEGADRLLEAIYHYDENYDEHKANNEAFLDTLSPYNKNLVKAYETSLEEVLH
ncbi:DUF2827 family protein [uncultured Veillonella sp.]|uniref:DUF2827 family protein n=1 Tax=uncultured Veillonella sp. TaxID=159268 RepID=UPI00260F05B3|nr:DUF2827 family protein [uncultured Veillonella sp.]